MHLRAAISGRPTGPRAEISRAVRAAGLATATRCGLTARTARTHVRTASPRPAPLLEVLREFLVALLAPLLVFAVELTHLLPAPLVVLRIVDVMAARIAPLVVPR